ncbi:uncharacterized protein net isoform X2 [Eurosta solidaginis]|uniref:uncharacterized protein net isoform X2 n=1 Tax=Eurosta solidaginis TaxID=178769 RepID=UPI0035312E06
MPLSVLWCNCKIAAASTTHAKLITSTKPCSSPNSNDRDAGFCSGSSEGGDDLDRIDHARLEPSFPTSPTDITTEASEDSVEVKVTPIALVRNKRKSSEPSKVVDASVTATAAGSHASALSTAPLKKRIRYTSTTDSAVVLTPPTLVTPPPAQHDIWDPSQVLPHELMPNPAQVFVRHPGVTTLHRIPVVKVEEQVEPLALVAKKSTENERAAHTVTRALHTPMPCTNTTVTSEPAPSIYVPKKQQATAHSQQQTKFHASTESVPLALTTAHTITQHLSAAGASMSTQHDAQRSVAIAEQYKPSSAEEAPSGSCGTGSGSARPQQRNYKNMTRERRIEANARERTRVHTISAAYETLRRAVPSYSNAQKLSKLSVLRIACSYILTLSRMAGEDYSADGSEPTIADCFDAVTETIQTEGKIRKKKDE